MNIQLPDGKIVENVPDDTSRDDFIAKANRNGLNLPKDAQLRITRTMTAGPSPDTMASTRTATSQALQIGLPAAAMFASGIGAPEGAGLLASAARTGIGSAAGEMAQRQIRKSAMGEQTGPESIKRSAFDFGVGVFSELQTKVLSGVAKRAFAFGADSDAIAADNLLKSKGLPGLLPDEMKSGGLRRYIGSLSRGAPLGSSELRNYVSERSGEWTKYLTDMAHGIASSVEATTAGQSAIDTLSAMRQAFHNVANIGYKEIGAVADPPQAVIDALSKGSTEAGEIVAGMSSTVKALNPSLAGEPDWGNAAKIDLSSVKAKASEMAKEIKASGFPVNSTLEEIEKSGDATWFSRAQDWRSALRKIGRSAGAADQSSVLSGGAAQVESALDKAMKSGLEEVNPELGKELDIVDNMYRQGRDTFYNSLTKDIVKSTAKNGPESVAGKIFKPEGMAAQVTPIQRAKSALTGTGLDAMGAAAKGSQSEGAILSAIKQYKDTLPKEAYQNLQGVFVDYMLREASKDGTISATKMASVLNSFGRPAIEEAFGKQQTKDLMDMVIAMQKGESQGSNIGKFVVSNRQLVGGAIIGATLAGAAVSPNATVRGASRSMLIGGALFLGGPYVVGRLWTNPTTRKLLIRGLTTPSTTEYGARIASSLGAAAYLARQQQDFGDDNGGGK
jgi:hypothetical protein